MTLSRSCMAAFLTGWMATLAWGQLTPEYATTYSYMTTTAPVIDGVPEAGEWDAAGPWLVVNADNSGAADSTPDADTYGGDEDASFRFKSMWLEDTWQLFFLFEITDDIDASADPREDRFWERDQIELFLEGTTLEGEDDAFSFHWWEADETYGKFGVSRENDFEGNSGKMTDDPELWADFDPDFPILSVSNTSDTGVAGNFYIEYGITLEGMWEDLDNNPFEGTQTEVEEHIVADSTQVKFTVSYSDDDDVDFEDPVTDRAHTLTYYRVEGTTWDQSTGFSDLVFTGEFDGVLAPVCEVPAGGIPGDLDGDGEVAFADFLVLSGNFGSSGDIPYADGDIDCDGEVAFADFLALSANFGQTAGAAASVPEPAAGWLLLMGLLALPRRRRM